jgi:hypothetical protein
MKNIIKENPDIERFELAPAEVSSLWRSAGTLQG